MNKRGNFYLTVETALISKTFKQEWAKHCIIFSKNLVRTHLALSGLCFDLYVRIRKTITKPIKNQQLNQF